MVSRSSGASAASSRASAAALGTPAAANGSSGASAPGFGAERLGRGELGGERIAAADRTLERRGREREPGGTVAARRRRPLGELGLERLGRALDHGDALGQCVEVGALDGAGSRTGSGGRGGGRVAAAAQDTDGLGHRLHLALERGDAAGERGIGCRRTRARERGVEPAEAGGEIIERLGVDGGRQRTRRNVAQLLLDRGEPRLRHAQPEAAVAGQICRGERKPPGDEPDGPGADQAQHRHALAALPRARRRVGRRGGRGCAGRLGAVSSRGPFEEVGAVTPAAGSRLRSGRRRALDLARGQIDRGRLSPRRSAGRRGGRRLVTAHVCSCVLVSALMVGGPESLGPRGFRSPSIRAATVARMKRQRNPGVSPRAGRRSLPQPKVNRSCPGRGDIFASRTSRAPTGAGEGQMGHSRSVATLASLVPLNGQGASLHSPGDTHARYPAPTSASSAASSGRDAMRMAGAPAAASGSATCWEMQK